MMIFMSEKKENLSLNALITLAIITVIILVLGLILLLLGLNEAFYSSSSTIRSIFKAITYLGEPIVFIIVVAVIYIIYDKGLAKNVALSLLIAVYLNEFFKNIFKDLRPATNVDPDNISAENPSGLVETSYGLPSGHAQDAVGTWGYIAYQFRDKPRFYVTPIIFSIVIFLVAISRIIIGVHDLQDIIGGLLLGLCFLTLFIYLEPIISEKFNRLSLSLRLIIVVIASILLFALGTFLFPTSGKDLLPDPPSFTDTGGFAQVGGVLLGLGIGYLLENKYINYQPSQLNGKQKIINIVITIVILFVAYFALEALSDIFDSVIYRYIRYALIAFILFYIVPLILTKIKK